MQNLPISSIGVVALPDGSTAFGRTTVSFTALSPSGIAQILAAQAKPPPVIIKGIIPGWTATVSQEMFVAHTRLTKLFLRAHFEPSKVGFVPVWTPNDMSLEMALTWTPPEEIRVFLVLSSGVPIGAGWMASIFYAGTDNRSRCMPLPNIYNDGRVCMGDDWAPIIQSGEVCEVLDKSLKHFLSSPFNSDLLTPEKLDASKRWFFFDSNSNQRHTINVEDGHVLSSLPINAVMKTEGISA